MADYLDDMFKQIKGKKGEKQLRELQQKIEKEIAVRKEEKDKAEAPRESQREKETKKQEETRSTPATKETIEGGKKAEIVKEVLVTETEKQLEKEDKVEVEAYENVKIFRIRGQPLLYYWTKVVVPTSGEKLIINTVREVATRLITDIPYKIRDPEQRRNVYFQKVLEIIRDSPELNVPLTKSSAYAEAVVSEMVGYGIIDKVIKDDNLEEIMINGANKPVYVFHRKHGMMISNLEFSNDNDIQDLVNKIARQVGRRVDIASPLLDARMLDGSRVNATIPPASVEGSTLTIRKFREEPYSIVDLIENGTLDSEAAAFLWMCVEGMRSRPANILIAGGTGSGKTTMLNVLASFIPESERVITIEDTAELNLPLKHWVRLEARPPGLEGTGELKMDILTKNALRMRPDRIIVGEIRHDEAFTLFTAFNTGQDGSLGTVHANSAQETIVRVTSPPMSVPEVMLSGLNLIIILHRLHDKKKGTIRRVMEISEVSGALEGSTRTVTVYKRDADADAIRRTNAPIEYLKLLEEMTGVTKNRLAEEIIRRSEFFADLRKKKVREMKEVSEKMKEYLEKGE